MKFCKILSLVLVLLFVFTACSRPAGKTNMVGLNPTDYQGVVFVNGGMSSESGTNNRARMDVIRTRDFLKIEDFEKIELGDGYHMVFVLYSDRDYTSRVTSTGWLADGQDLNFSELVKNNQMPVYEAGYEPVYFKVVMASNSDSNMTVEDGKALTLLKDGKTESPAMSQGTIDKGTVHSAVTTRLHTTELLSLKDYESVSVASGYKACYHIYNSDGQWLGSSSGWQDGKDEVLFTCEQMLDTSKLGNYISGKNPTYFKFQIKDANKEGAEVPVEKLADMGLNITTSKTADVKNLNYPENEKPSDFKFQSEFEIGAAVNGPWQEGAIWGGNLFAINHDGLGEVFSLENKESIGSFTLDKREVINPHANSVAFGSTYYEEGDKYPLMYVSVYNNYEHDKERYEGHCLVYRVKEDKKGFSTDLVQVIKIGFVEDLKLWKSMGERGDVNPFGNFVVDTDNNQLYAYVLRDKDQVTRFFKFDIPSVDEGKKNVLYGCNVVTLEPSDIKDQFDTEYFIYIQGTCYIKDMIVSVAGLGYGNEGGAQLNIIDLKQKKAIAKYDPISAGSYNEPEIMAVDRETNKVYFCASDGNVRYLTFMDKYIAEK